MQIRMEISQLEITQENYLSLMTEFAEVKKAICGKASTQDDQNELTIRVCPFS